MFIYIPLFLGKINTFLVLIFVHENFYLNNILLMQGKKNAYMSSSVQGVLWTNTRQIGYGYRPGTIAHEKRQGLTNHLTSNYVH